MPAVATAGSTYTCPHGFAMHVSAANPLLTVDGQAVVVRGDLLQATFDCTASGTGIKPCTRVASVDSGLSSTLLLAGDAAALETATGTTDGSPPAPWIVTSVNQSTLEAA